MTSPFHRFAVLLILTTGLSACASSPADAHRLRTTGVGVTVNVLPAGHRAVFVGQTRYYVHNGLYYHAQGKRFRMVPAPIGLRVATLPAGFVTINLKSGRFFRQGNTYYRAGRRGFVVVARPRGIRVVG